MVIERTTSRWIGVFVAVACLMVASAASAEGYAYDLAGELMSPYCPGRTVASCPSPQASELIQWIQVQEAGGASEEEVVEMLIERFGEEILGAPKAEGTGLLAYVIPVVGFVGGGGVAAVVIRRMVGQSDDDDDDDAGPPSTGGGASAPDAEPPAAGDDEFARRVEAELAARS